MGFRKSKTEALRIEVAPHRGRSGRALLDKRTPGAGKGRRRSFCIVASGREVSIISQREVGAH